MNVSRVSLLLCDWLVRTALHANICLYQHKRHGLSVCRTLFATAAARHQPHAQTLYAYPLNYTIKTNCLWLNCITESPNRCSPRCSYSFGNAIQCCLRNKRNIGLKLCATTLCLLVLMLHATGPDVSLSASSGVVVRLRHQKEQDR